MTIISPKMAENQTDVPIFASYLMTPQCYDTLVVEGNIFHVPCLQLVFSKLLGYAIILVTSTLMKTPQIIKILKAQSGQGVSFFSQFLMLVSSSISVGYSMARNHHISLWGESIAITLQTLIILLLILVYEGRSTRAVAFTVAYLLAMVIWLSPSIPLPVHVAMQMSGVFLGSFSKIIQIRTNYKNRGTGQLSAIYISLANFRSFGRLLTLFLATNDWLFISNQAIKSGLNVVQISQIIYYNKKNK